VYHAFVRSRVRGVYQRMSAGDWKAVAADAADDVYHVFPGAHALGGERHSRDALMRWLARVNRLLPDLRFEVTRVASTGGPWNTWASAEWVDWATLPDGEQYRNAGVVWINVRWGKVREIHEYLDSELVRDACERLAASGVDEAVAEPILD
jgi:ketosteroid isomerase-like protein